MFSPEERALVDDSKYKQYSNSIDKALKSFETSNEWADLISALGKLLKALNPKFKAIPKKTLIGKRLAQCMHPALPGGVHIKALAVYKAIFQILSNEQLAQDLYIYSTGIFPVYSTASMQVRPILLNLVEKHLVPLDKSLIVCLDGLMFGLLPGLEENTEHFERLDNVFNKLSYRIGKEPFYSSIWHCVLSQSPARLSAIQLVTRHFDKKLPTAYQSYILGTDYDVVVIGLSDAVQDSNILVQRAVLDFLVISFPFTTTVIPKDKHLNLLISSLTCVLRRDMSLNRRLYTWILGCEQTKLISNPSSALKAQVWEYFNKNSKDLLIQALNKLFAKQISVVKSYRRTSAKVSQQMIVEQMFPLKIITSLLDKAEVGPLILDDVLISIFRLLKAAVETSSKIECDQTEMSLQSFPRSTNRQTSTSSSESQQQSNLSCSGELLKTVKLFFSYIDEDVVWSFLVRRIKLIAVQNEGCESDITDSKSITISSSGATLGEICGFVTTLLRTLTLDGGPEVQTVWLPAISHGILLVLVEKGTEMSGSQVRTALETCQLLLGHTQPIESSTQGSIKSSTLSIYDLRVPSQDHDSGLEHDEEESITEGYSTVNNCYELLQKFFVLFVRYRLKCSSLDIQKCIDDITFDSAETDNLKPSTLEEENNNDDIKSVVKLDLNRAVPREEDELFRPCVARVFILTCRLMLDYACFPVYRTTADDAEEPVKLRPSPSTRKCVTPPPQLTVESVVTNHLKRSRSQSPTSRSRNPVGGGLPFDKSLFVRLGGGGGGGVGSGRSTSEDQKNVKKLTNSFRTTSEWVASLLWTCCGYFNIDDDLTSFDVFSSAISTAFDFISLVQNIGRAAEKKSDNGGTEGKVIVHMLSSFTHIEADFITYHTSFYSHISKILWKVLGDHRYGSSHLSAVRLLTRCHSVCPNTWCEDVILEEMTSLDKNIRVPAIEKFCRMWHLIRTCRNSRLIANDGLHIKTFGRCLFSLVDHLSHGGGVESTISFLSDTERVENSSVLVNSWLRQCLDVRDLGRILEPYLVVLLNEKTHSMPLKNDRLFASVPKQTLPEIIARSHEETMSSINDDSNSMDASEKDEDKNQPISPNAVHADIAKGKMVYRELVSKLTMSPDGTRKDTELHNIAEKIVADAIMAGYNHFKHKSAKEEEIPEVALDGVEDQKGKEMWETETDGSDISRASLLGEDDDTSNDDFSFSQEDIKLSISSTEENNDDYKIISHAFIYQEHFNARQVVYCLHSILNLLRAQPRPFTYASSTTQLSSIQLCTDSAYLQEMLARHDQAHKGVSFYGDIKTRLKSLMTIDVLIGICLHYLRSWPVRGSDLLQLDEVHEIRSIACQLLIALLTELRYIATEKSENVQTVIRPTTLSINFNLPLISSASAADLPKFNAYLTSIIEKHAVASTTIISLSATILAMDSEKDYYKQEMNSQKSSILMRRSNIHWWCGDNKSRVQSFQTLLLTLLHILLFIDEQNESSKLLTAASASSTATARVGTDLRRLRYLPAETLSRQPLLVSCLVKVFRAENLRRVQPIWMEFLTGSLSSLVPRFNVLASPLVFALCNNIDEASSVYESSTTNEAMCAKLGDMPPDYLVMCLKTLRVFIHTLLPAFTGRVRYSQPKTDQNQGVYASGKVKQCQVKSGGHNGRKFGSSPSSNQSTTPSSWVNVFNMFGTPQKNFKGVDEAVNSPLVLHMQSLVLKVLPRILTCLSLIWNRVVVPKSSDKYSQISADFLSHVIHPSSVMGSVEVISKHVLQILNPFVIQYGDNLVAAFAIVWEKQSRAPDTKTSGEGEAESFNAARISESQNNLLCFATSLTSLRCSDLIKLVKKVILQPPDKPQPEAKCQHSLQVSLLQFTLGYIRLQPTQTLLESRANIITLIREYLNSQGPAHTPSNATSKDLRLKEHWKRSPRSVFFLLLMLFEMARRLPAIEDKKQHKDLQEVCQKCVEACNFIVESSLEHGGWLARRVAAVVPDSIGAVPSTKTPPAGGKVNNRPASSEPEAFFPSPTSSSLIELMEEDIDVGKDEVQSSLSTSHLLAGTAYITSKSKVFELSIQAITVLSQILANLLDLVFANEEKDKIVPILTPVIANVTPYLKNRRAANTPAYHAAVKLLASVCGYQQTRRAWKKEVAELFFDSGFFHMPLDCVSQWRTVIDHLMTHDAATFKELMGRIGVIRSAGGPSSLNIFSSKDQEHELRASMLKRVTFVLFSSDVNQFRSHLPEIQERLAESLRLHHVPAIQEQVFLCFRVLLLRVLPSNLTALWPSMLTELFQIFLRIEQEIEGNSLIGGAGVSGPNKNKKTFTPGSVHQKLVQKSSVSTNNSSNGSVSSAALSVAPTPSSNHSTNNSHNEKMLNTKKLALYLSVCKLLDLLLILQPDQLPHFKLFLWSFVGKVGTTSVAEEEDESWLEMSQNSRLSFNSNTSPSTKSNNSSKDSSSKNFVPLCVRIRRLLAEKHPSGASTMLSAVPLRPLLTLRNINSLLQLQAFFNTITSPATSVRYHRRRIEISKRKGDDGKRPVNLTDILTLLERDFAEV